MKRFYITTPIYYVSERPHLGHAYTTIVADALARYQRLRGRGTGFLTGTDEHGQKVARIAAERGLSPQDYADAVAGTYRDAWKALNISNDDFIRTTDADHEHLVQEIWCTLEERGDIYLDKYQGWYCVACEQFYAERELVDGAVCPVHRRGVELLEEPSYYFRLSSYQDRLLAHIEANPEFVQPEARRNEVLAFVRQGLQDLSISRTTLSWGVPVPNHPGHVVYVWIDALFNYYSATRRRPLDGCWDLHTQIVHLVGKEISRFHAVYWPALLMAAGLRLPSVVHCHGWWTVDGEKMSKTAGNVVDPIPIARELGADALRYFLLREVPLGADGDFSHATLLARYNAELANDLGNLLSRVLNMIERVATSTAVPPAESELRTIAEAARAGVARAMETFQPSVALDRIWHLVRACNTYIERAAPWRAPESDRDLHLSSLRAALRFVACMIEPFMPGCAAEMRSQLGAGLATWPHWDEPFEDPCVRGPALFPRIDKTRMDELLGRWTVLSTAASRLSAPKG